MATLLADQQPTPATGTTGAFPMALGVPYDDLCLSFEEVLLDQDAKMIVGKQANLA
jgi:hypothetical protein